MKKNWLKTLQLILLMLASGALGYFMMIGVFKLLPPQIEYLKGGGALGIFYICLLLITSYFIVTALHELGHLLTGLAQGFRFYLYVVGFLEVKLNENERVRFYFNTDMQLFGGIAGSFPTNDDPANLRKMAWVVAAGPLTSLFTGILFAWATFTMVYNLTPDSSGFYKITTGFCLLSALMSFVIFLATTLPSRTGPFFTDRARFFRLIRGGKAAQIEQAVMQLIALSYAGKRYRDLDIATILLIKSDESPVLHSISDFYAYYYYLDLQAFEQALPYAQKMQEASQGLPISMKNEYLREAAFSFAFIEKNAEKALNAWQPIASFFEKQETVSALRTKIALLLVQNQLEPAADLLQKVLTKLGAQPTKGADLLEKDLLDQLQKQLTDCQLIT